MSENRSGQEQPGLWDLPRAHLSVRRGHQRRASQSIKRRPGGQEVEQRATIVAPSATTAASERFVAEDLWVADRVAAYLGEPKQTLSAWRHARKGPKGFRVAKHLRRRAHTVVGWTVELERDQ